ncbi:MAG: single-stranded-DNA-specific exonuclease RecJ, partial [Phycisphaerae bacterium]
LGDLNTQLVDDLARLEPYGAGNPGPTLATDWLELAGEPRTVGTSGSHLQVRLSDGRSQCRGIAFGMGKYADPLRDHRRCRAAFRPTLNQWQGNTNVEMQIIDFRFPE